MSNQPEPVSRSELESALARFFQRSGADVVAALATALSELRVDPERYQREWISLVNNRGSYRGQAWKEILDRDPIADALTFAMYVAASHAGYPKPLPYCPDELVGTWNRESAHAETWTFGPSGELQVSNSIFAGFNRWHVELQTDSAELRHARVRLFHGDLGEASLLTLGATREALELAYAGATDYAKDTIYRLVRRA
jgi:hypothetical protein